MTLAWWEHIQRQRKEKPDLAPEEVEQLVRSKASEASLLLYQETIVAHVPRQVSDVVERHAKGYARAVEGGSYTDSGVVDALTEMAAIIRTSTFPAHPIRLQSDPE